MKDVLKVDDWLGSQNAQFEFCDDGRNFASRLKDGVVFGINTLLYMDKIDDDRFLYHVLRQFHEDKIHVTIECMLICNDVCNNRYTTITEINNVKFGG